MIVQGKYDYLNKKLNHAYSLPHTNVFHVLNPSCPFITSNDKEAKEWSTIREATIQFQSQ
jgi:hypothetical protein